MRSRLRIVAAAFVAALLAFLFALPILKADRCAERGMAFDRSTLACAAAPAHSPTRPPTAYP
ncbi:hypothetical protein [Sphingomonas sp. VNH70]|uniref:hypothetical protein n=1 Tax=Sphingomonas silueang TaxID=3156617 RepID=UPI0032B4AEC6